MLSQNVDLRPYNTFRISVQSQYFAAFKTIDELRQLIESHRDKPIMILGGGSNVLFTKDYKGLVLRNEIKGKTIEKETDDTVFITVGAGENWHEFVLYSIDHNWGGIENLSLIPGSVGASPMQNIGAYGVEIKDCFYELKAFHIETGEIHTFSHSDCKFAYRESVFKKELNGKYVIVSVTFKLTKNHSLNTSYGAIEAELEKMNVSEPTIKDVSDAVIAIRQSKLPDPKKIGNAGSFFKNPVIPKALLKEIQIKYPTVPSYPVNSQYVKLPAGWLIDQAGWRGRTFGNFGIHQKQALVLVNYSGASGGEIFKLSQMILDDIKDKFNIVLEREVNII